MGEEDMSTTVTLILSLAVALGGGIAKKYYTDRDSTRFSGGFVFNAVSSLAAAIVLLCWGGFGMQISAFTALLGIIFGAVTALQGITNIAALQVGPMSYTSVIISFSTLISALSGVMFFDEHLGWAQIVGIILMLVSFVLAAKSDGGEKKANLKWLLLCLVAFAATGGIGVMQKVHQSSEHRDELNAFLIIAFISSAVICTLLAVFFKMQENGSKSTERDNGGKKQFWLMLAIMIAGGACAAANNKFNLYLSGVMDSAVFFPTVNGGGLVLTTLAAVLLFRERLTAKQWFGVVFGIASVVFLCNPFA